MRRRPVAFHQARTEEPVVAARGTRVWGRLLRSMFVVCALVLLSSALILCRSALHRDLSVVRHYHPPGVQPVQDGSHLRVMAYNIAHGRGSRSFSGRGGTPPRLQPLIAAGRSGQPAPGGGRHPRG